MAFYLPTTTSKDCLANKDGHIVSLFRKTDSESESFVGPGFSAQNGVCIGLMIYILQNQVNEKSDKSDNSHTFTSQIEG